MELSMLIIMTVMLAGFIWFKIGDVFAPWTITVLIWLAILVMFQFQGNLLFPLGPKFLTCLTLWVPIFCLSSIATYAVMPGVDNPQKVSQEKPAFNSMLFNFLYYVSMIITPLYVYRILQIVMMFDTSDMLYNIRLLAIYGEESFGVLNYSYVLNQVLLIVALWEYPRVPLWKVLTIVAASLLSAFAIMEKGMLFYLFASLAFVLYEKRVIKMRSIMIAAASVVLIFFLVNIARDYREDADPNDAMTFVDFFGIYIMSPAVAFEFVEEDVSPQWGSNTFQTIYLFLNRFGGDYEVNKKIQEYVWVPLPTNVYTIFQPYFEDFKYKGVAFFAMFLGVVSGWLYRLSRNGNGFGKCGYSLMVYVLALQFFQENFFISIVHVIQFFFFIYLMMQQEFDLYFGLADKAGGKVAEEEVESPPPPEEPGDSGGDSTEVKSLQI